MNIPRIPVLLILLISLLTICSAPAQTDVETNWHVLGPILVDQAEPDEVSEEQRKKAFNTEYLDATALTTVKAGQLHTINGSELKWQTASEKDGIVNLNKLFDKLDYVSAYSWTEIQAPEARPALLGIGSDDAVKVWVNGELVHEHWIGRGVTRDEDLVPVELQKGKNRILLKVQDHREGWGFACRILPAEVYTQKLIEAAGKGHADEVGLLLSHGADIDAKNDVGLTPLHSAKIHGRRDVVAALQQRGANPDIPMPTPESLADHLFAKAFEGEIPGAAALVVREGKVLYEKGFGYADLKKKTPITPDTEFRIGSITKQFTAVAILKLQEEGKLNVEDKLSKFIPDYPRGDEVTIHHLLTHTSGIKSYTDKINFKSKEVTRPIPSIEKHIESFKHDPFNFDPGESWSYNNSGYFLLGYIIGKVSGLSYGEYLQQTFFDLLGMKNTGLHHKRIKLQHEAMGYSYQNGKPELAPNWEMTWAGGAGAMYSTLGDLYRWNEAAFNGKVLTAASMQSAFTPVVLENGKESEPKYGYGWMIQEFRGWQEIQHGGGLPGFSTYLCRFPQQNITVAVLTNALPSPKLNPGQAAHELAEIFFGEEMDEQTSYIADKNADASVYKDYVGRYEYKGGAVLAVSTEGNQLFVQLGMQPRFEIFPSDADEFFWKVVEAQVKFVRNESGHVTHAVHTQNGRSFEAPRLEEEDAVAISPSILKNYVGKYDMNGTAVDILLKEEQLYIQAANQPQIQLYARSATEFFLTVVKADITFMENEAGEVDKFTLKQGGRTFTVLRKK